MNDVTQVLNDFIRSWTSSGRPALYRSLQRWPICYAIVPLAMPGVPLITFECTTRNGNIVATSATVNRHLTRMLGKADVIYFKEELLRIMNGCHLFGPIAYRQLNIYTPDITGHGYPQFGYKAQGTSELVWVGNDSVEVPDDALLYRRENESSALKAELGIAVTEDAFTVHFPDPQHQSQNLPYPSMTSISREPSQQVAE